MVDDPNDDVFEKRFVEDAVVAKRVVLVALVNRAFVEVAYVLDAPVTESPPVVELKVNESVPPKIPPSLY